MKVSDIKRGKCSLSIDEIIQYYTNGISTKEIGRMANVSDRYIRSLLNQNKVEMKETGSWKRKFKVNEDYFKTWSSTMAYILGFFFADGCIVKDQQSISFAQKEKYILEKIKVAMDSNHPIIINEKTGVHILNIHSKILKKDLIELYGLTPNKSKVVEFPNIPPDFLSHFIRGYFDGDGYVSYRNYFISFVGGSESFMLSLQEVIAKQGFETNFTTYETHYRVYVSGRKTIKHFSDWMYQEKNLYLPRKYDEFQKEKDEVSLLRDNIKTHKNALILRGKQS
ncbi:LAGLIDADG family homing endonuclease [Planomicrobium sp. CPCC 101079]|uniref:LAGLIDADG family homing endonuclease n=1 Tax=Planomicrobium sp. CPCC 101079 TaxID=2599618 RepID=UPI0011B68705|nr:LAGLIDADG family homing endonuclease [Planomicrobium sp. CPCC 101079]TWT09319.1 hypothetical protein FQV28_06710 [Planomicrobium sp. CPCC 101079]